MSFKEAESNKESKYISIVLGMLSLLSIGCTLKKACYNFWFSPFVLVELPSAIIFLVQYSFAPTHIFCALIGKYITFTYAVDPTRHYINIVLDDCFIHQLSL